LTQGELATRAGVSRALVGSLERGRHMPATDTAVRVARTLGTSVERLFDVAGLEPAVVALPVLGGRLEEGALVRAARVGEGIVVRVVDPASAMGGIAALADGVVDGKRVRMFPGASPHGAVIAGCDPVLAIAEALLERAGEARIVGVPASTGESLKALGADRCHAALVHGPPSSLEPAPGLRRWHLARWRSGIATHPRLARPSVEALLADDVAMVQRDESAASQQAVLRAARRLGAPALAPRRLASSHLEAGRSALEHGSAAVTIEPIAIALGLDFAELETHEVELWVPDRWSDLPGVGALAELISTRRFLDRAGALPAYDLTDTGTTR
jgi:DNA-binding XRE family transcriptional regulator